MRELTADLLVGRLVDWGVDTVFGLPADSADGVVEAFARLGDRIRLVLVHHEEAAALMAAGYAKATGRVGVCLATSGPGALRLLGGLYDAKLDHQPVLAVTESQEIRLLGTSFFMPTGLVVSGQAVANVSVATTSKRKDRTSGEMVERLEHIDLLRGRHEQEAGEHRALRQIYTSYQAQVRAHLYRKLKPLRCIT